MDVRFSIRPELRQRMRQVARAFRKEPTQSETLLWQELRNRKLEGRKFRRQRPVGPFVVDFLCLEERLVIEIDGPIHRSQSTADQERQQLLEAAGLHVIRVSSTNVETDVNAVLKRIRQVCPPPTADRPLLRRAGGPSPASGRGETGRSG